MEEAKVLCPKCKQEDLTYIVAGDRFIDKPYDSSCSVKQFIEENQDKLTSLNKHSP